jgi:hypothetical protein
LIGEYRGKQELWSQQSPQVLDMLREASIIESTESSNLSQHHADFMANFFRENGLRPSAARGGGWYPPGRHHGMSEKRITRRGPGQREQGKTNWKAIHQLTDDRAEAAAVRDADNPPWSDEELRSAELVWPTAEARGPQA